MKQIYILILLGTPALLGSCKKENKTIGTTSLNIIQANLTIPSVYVYFTNSPSNYYLQSNTVTNSSSSEFGLSSGNTQIAIVSSDDTLKPIYSGAFDLKSGKIYSFYIIGNDSGSDTLLMEDNIPVLSDSSAGVRFINLSMNSQPISINLAGNDPTSFEFSNLTYKKISTFKKYPGNQNTMSYDFEIRDQQSGNLLTTLTWNYNYNKNNTIIIAGSEDPSSSTPISAFQVNNF